MLRLFYYLLKKKKMKILDYLIFNDIISLIMTLIIGFIGIIIILYLHFKKHK